MKAHSWFRFLVWGSILAISFYFGSPQPTAAHAGGTPLIINEPAGPFLVSAWSLPNPVTANAEANLIVALASPSDDPNSRAGLVVLEADIAVTFTSPDGSESFTVTPNHASATNKLFYETYFEFPDDGTWTADIAVSKAGEQGATNFSLVVEPGENNGLDINWMLVGGTAVLLIGLGWFGWQTRTSQNTPKTKQS